MFMIALNRSPKIIVVPIPIPGSHKYEMDQNWTSQLSSRSFHGLDHSEGIIPSMGGIVPLTTSQPSVVKKSLWSGSLPGIRPARICPSPWKVQTRTETPIPSSVPFKGDESANSMNCIGNKNCWYYIIKFGFLPSHLPMGKTFLV